MSTPEQRAELRRPEPIVTDVGDEQYEQTLASEYMDALEARIAELESRKPEEVYHGERFALKQLLEYVPATMLATEHNSAVKQWLRLRNEWIQRLTAPPAVSEAKEGSHDGDSGASRTQGGQHG